MKAKIKAGGLSGSITIPGSKSHMIRSLYFAALADGTSIIRNPVRSSDGLSALRLIRALGVKIDDSNSERWTVEGGKLRLPEDVIDVGNSGTSMNLGSALLASLDGRSVVTGDKQIRRRPAQPVLNALMQLGAEAFTLRNNGSAPFLIRGPLQGGKTFVDGLISQYASSALIAASLSPRNTEVIVHEPNEISYLEMTLHWMQSLGVEVEGDWGKKKEADFSRFFVKSGQTYRPFDTPVPGDFSSAAFPLIGAAISDSEVRLMGLSVEDVQGDKILIDILRDMGATVEVERDRTSGIMVHGGDPLRGKTIDCGVTPDSVPILSVLGCRAEGETRLENIASSRLKETDRPLLMVRELKKMGADIELRDDELIIRNSRLSGAEVESHGDHRIAMALCMAGLIAKGETLVDDIGCAAVSYPGFEQALIDLGAKVEFFE